MRSKRHMPRHAWGSSSCWPSGVEMTIATSMQMDVKFRFKRPAAVRTERNVTQSKTSSRAGQCPWPGFASCFIQDRGSVSQLQTISFAGGVNVLIIYGPSTNDGIIFNRLFRYSSVPFRKRCKGGNVWCERHFASAVKRF